ncbi:hypothetical protein RD792_011432 [Penstemon davidsonii]|uniref:non-specific serine/threonine protein kinase n=1 Tax=Penstemon davidsonii TaxID=160366 RepID=A0ABR0D5C8_9LAMI|nr:hypothetical protein RD792_011432 [Penstemon davidsonii]
MSTDESSLLALKAQITHDPNNILVKNWTQGSSLCTWIGVTCSRRSPRVTGLNLFNMGLQGTIANEIGNLSFLKHLNISNNSFIGQIPSEIGHLRRLRELRIRYNQLNGQIPLSFGLLSNLEVLDLSGNNLIGTIPWSIFNISSLQGIDLYKNQLSGTLPPSICHHLPKLKFLILSNNQLGGNIPRSLTTCAELNEIYLSDNNFIGNIPMQIGNLSQLQYLSLGENNLTVTNMSNLDVFDLSWNSFHGAVPSEMGRLSNLTWLNLAGNKLDGDIPQSIFNLSKLELLDLIDNELSGNIPFSIGKRLPRLSSLHLGANRFSGRIPESISNLSKLGRLEIGYNLLSGHIPINLGNLQELQYLGLEENQFTNDLSTPEQDFITPLTKCNMSSCNLLWLGLGGNVLNGVIPESLGKLRSLQRLEIDNNKLQGSIPHSFCDLKNFYYLSLSGNKLYGQLPSCLGGLTFMREIYLEDNAFNSIPTNFWSNELIQKIYLDNNFLTVPCLQKLELEHLDISHNNISGSIPPSFEILANLRYFNVSFNKLSGEIPDGGTFKNFTADFFIHNKGLCGASRFKVEVFNLEVQSAFKSFDTECQIMRNIRHKNIVKVITSCSNLDFRALVMEYMPNGNLEKWLHSPNSRSNIGQRLGIMIDVASALEYLHQGCSSPIVHCDIKPNNILLDEDMIARVSDFGISMLLMEDQKTPQTRTLGTVGYMAPEYGSAGLVTTMVDAYSFGILLMEMFTRKSPTDEMFSGELTMRRWMSESFPDYIMHLIDAELLKEDERTISLTHQKSLTLIIGLALECTADVPEERLDMKVVLKRLKVIKTELTKRRGHN